MAKTDSFISTLRFSKLQRELYEKIHYVKLFSEKRITVIEYYDFNTNIQEWIRLYLLFENYKKYNFNKVGELQASMIATIRNIINDEDSTIKIEEFQSDNVDPGIEQILYYYSQLMNHAKDFPLLKNEVFKKVIEDLYQCFLTIDKTIDDSSEFWNWEPLFSNPEKKEQNVSETPKQEKKGSVLDLTERLLIITLLQKHQLFPMHSTKLGQTQKMMDDFVSVLLNENIDSIEKARKKIDVFFDTKNITTAQKPFKIKNLNNIKPYFESLGKPEIVSEIDLMINNIDKI